MGDKVCIIKQPAGIGDIFFCQKIAQSVLADTDCVKVIWPVSSIYSYLKDYPTDTKIIGIHMDILIASVIFNSGVLI